MFFISKRNSIPISSHSLSLPPTSPWQVLIYFLSLCVCLFWTVVFESASFPSARCSGGSPLQHVGVLPHFYGLPILCYMWVVPEVGVLGIKLLWTFILRFLLYEHVFSLLAGMYLGVALRGCVVTLFNFLRKDQVFSTAAAPFCIPTSMPERPSFSTFLPTLITLCLFYYSSPVDMKGISLW